MKINKQSFIICLLTATAFLQMQCSSSKNVNTDKNKVITETDGVNPAWVEATQGNIPLVISAPHGGGISPEEIPDRTCGTKEKDSNTALLAYQISDAFEKKGQKPFLVVAQIARTKIDLNRDMEVATCGNEVMNSTWKQYHKYIDAALQKAVDKFGYAIYIDLHGQSHAVKRLELGYLLRKPDLEKNSTESISDPALAAKSSLSNLLTLTNNKQSIKELLIGENALGTFFESNGYPAVPSLQDPYPKEKEAYFTGGYNTRRYTSKEYPKVFGLQIEANFTSIRDSKENREKFSEAFVKSITSYINFVETEIN